MKIDAMQQSELLQAVETLRSFIENLETRKSCGSCAFWDGGYNANVKGGCKLAAGEMPPPDIIQNGCNSWKVFDEIPF